MRPAALQLILRILVVACVAPLARGSDVMHVDPAAPEGGSGSADAPFRTIVAARDAVRLMLEESAPPPGGIEIVLHGGDYLRESSISLDERDSGRADAPIIYRAAGDGRPWLIGGVVLSDFRLDPVANETIRDRLPSDDARDHVGQVDLKTMFGKSIQSRLVGPVHRGMGVSDRAVGNEVFLDGRALVRSRWPNADSADGFARVTSIIDVGTIPRNRADDIAPEKRETRPPRGGIVRFDHDRVDRWRGAQDAWMFGYWRWDWADEQLPVEEIDSRSREITLGLPHRYGLKAGTPFYITNLLEELDAPGEYYIDRGRGMLYLWPPEGRRVGRLSISTLGSPLLRLEGTRHVQFIGLRFECTRGLAIEAVNVQAVTIAGCSIRNTGSGGLVISGSQNIVRSNDLTDIGGTAISVSGGDRTTLTPANNRIVNNDVQRFGRVWRTYHPAIRVGGVGQHIANNRLHDGPHSAIIFAGNDHLMELNDISDVLRETGDAGAIYCGRDWTLHGTVIRHNLIHHIRGTSSRWQNGVYLDDMASGIHVIGNVFFECNWGMLIGGGRDLLIHGNVFIGGRQAVRFDARGVGWMASHIADPSRSTLHRNLEAVPYRKPPWSERFPQLRRYLTDGFGRPMGSAVTGNVAIRVAFGTVADPEAVEVTGNVERDALPAGIIVANEATREVRFGVDELMIAEVADFEPIPVGRIGLIEDEYRHQP